MAEIDELGGVRVVLSGTTCEPRLHVRQSESRFWLYADPDPLHSLIAKVQIVIRGVEILVERFGAGSSVADSIITDLDEVSRRSMSVNIESIGDRSGIRFVTSWMACEGESVFDGEDYMVRIPFSVARRMVHEWIDVTGAVAVKLSSLKIE